MTLKSDLEIVRERRATMHSESVLEPPYVFAPIRERYGNDASHFGDLWLPPTAAPHKVVVFIHGGYWRAKYGLEHAGCACHALSQLGYAVWQIEYRRIGNGGAYPNTMLDVARAIEHLRVIAPQYALDLDQVVLMGHSAGGHLALWYAGAAHLPADSELRVERPLHTRGIVALAPVTDVFAAYEANASNGVAIEFIGGRPGEYARRYAHSSPRSLVPLRTPQILIHGTNDDSVPYDMSVKYVSVARAAGDDARLITLEGQGHFEVIDPWSDAWQQVVGAVKHYIG